MVNIPRVFMEASDYHKVLVVTCTSRLSVYIVTSPILALIAGFYTSKLQESIYKVTIT